MDSSDAGADASASGSGPQQAQEVGASETQPVNPEAGSSRFREDVTLESLRQRLADFAAERDWDQYHTPRNLLLAMVGEAGELCELFQWRPDAEVTRGLPGFTPKERTAVEEELADVLLYLVRLADVCGVDLPAAATAKIAKNAAKYPAERCRGSSAKYTEYQAMRAEARARRGARGQAEGEERGTEEQGTEAQAEDGEEGGQERGQEEGQGQGRG
ncbi:hypothetical protein HYH03_000274 [Edaphochlamys debaryana]|uniref:Uncharacterized protein n=1 Tax=Edaphochlamys debaryana TaxID=47281 RepID=A0A836C794_9CHLO|nr:hypothetical protein HYH03_000274 [Edaphochlamys debaryana]|eukprot:KAG2501774.1 hypothetical protein HYH03_000274 [Edaphochlamys debaryana]